MKRKVEKKQLEKIKKNGGTINDEKSIWLLDFWGKKNILGLIMDLFNNPNPSANRRLAGFSKIGYRTSPVINQGYIRFHSDNKSRVIVTVDSDLIEYTNISVRNGVLIIGINSRDGTVAFDEFTVDVYCNGITDVTIAGAGEFECIDEIKSPSFN
jgi:hypothetical protein